MRITVNWVGEPLLCQGVPLGMKQQHAIRFGARDNVEAFFAQYLSNKTGPKYRHQCPTMPEQKPDSAIAQKYGALLFVRSLGDIHEAQAAHPAAEEEEDRLTRAFLKKMGPANITHAQKLIWVAKRHGYQDLVQTLTQLCEKTRLNAKSERRPFLAQLKRLQDKLMDALRPKTLQDELKPLAFMDRHHLLDYALDTHQGECKYKDSCGVCNNNYVNALAKEFNAQYEARTERYAQKIENLSADKVYDKQLQTYERAVTKNVTGDMGMLKIREAYGKVEI